MLNTDKRPAQKALCGAAILHFLPAALYWPIVGLKWDINDWVRIAGVALFMLLAACAIWRPLSALAIGIVAYGLYLAALVVYGPGWQLLPWIVASSVMVVLLLGWAGARRRALGPAAGERNSQTS